MEAQGQRRSPGLAYVIAAIGAIVLALGSYALGHRIASDGDNELRRYCVVSEGTANERTEQVGALIGDGGSGCIPGELAYCWSSDDPTPTRC